MSDREILFTSTITWYKPSTPPDDGSSVAAIIREGATMQLQPVIFYDDANREYNTHLWVVNEGCNEGDEYNSESIVAWADDYEVAKEACESAALIVGIQV